MKSIFRLLLTAGCIYAPLAATFPANGPEQKAYEFTGRHLVVSYRECNPDALKNISELQEVMKRGVEASGAHLLDSAKYVFEPDGLTMILLLSESHASIHTYPEHGACFVDFFTCGSSCSAEAFDAVLQEFLQPAKVEKQIFLRN